MSKKIISFMLVTAVALIGVIGSISFFDTNVYAVEQSDPEQLSTEVELIRSNEAGIHFNLQTSAFQLDSDEAGIRRVNVEGLARRIAEPGAPDLPYYKTYIAVPPGAEVSVDVVETAVIHEQVDNITPVADTEFVLDDAGGVMGSPRQIIEEDASIYGRNANYPTSLYSLSESVYYRDLGLIALELYPVQYNPVAGEIRQAKNLEVHVSFTGMRLTDLRPLSAESNRHQADLSHLVLNYAESEAWRSLPTHVVNAPETVLPIGVDTYKIAVTEDGIYEVCQPELADSGMDVANVNPNTIQMLYRGEDVAYQFMGDSDNSFEANECVRFYGWAFTGTRPEENFISENIFWLWAGGTATNAASASNETTGALKTTAWYTQTKEPEIENYHTRSNQWDTFPNEPDIWYWDRIQVRNGTLVYTMTLADPDISHPDANYLLEFMDRQNNSTLAYSVTATINDPVASISGDWIGHKNVNIEGNIPGNVLLDGDNTLTLTVDFDQDVYLNRITIFYMRHLIAENDQLIFIDEAGGDRLQVSGFSNDNAIIWNITEPEAPVRITNPDASGGDYTFGLNHDAGAKFIATTESNVKSVQSIEQYVPLNLNPAGNGADWLAITHALFQAQTMALAQHRSDHPIFGGLTTHVVDIEDVINQYGYGLPLPEAIKNYLTYALGNWNLAPTYVTLVGDATYNPRGLDCETCSSWWDMDAQNFVPTDLQFVDRSNGMIPTDHTFVLLSGDDLLADMAIGRISVNTVEEATNAIGKIILYETNLLVTPPNLSSKFLFVADNEDDGGFFCDENVLTAAHLPINYADQEICLGSISYPDVDSVREEMFDQIRDGLFILNYRGHGSVNWWASEGILTTSTFDTFAWTNDFKPTFILSADCLDGHFASPGLSSMSETYLRYDNAGNKVGSAGMWSSTGLGLTFEHTILHQGFYDGLFVANGRTVGEAINYAKLQYFTANQHPSELYSFTLQGDPAMSMAFRDDFLFLPAITK